MKKLKIYTVDAFTNQQFNGNPAGVVVDADALTIEEMKLIAKEINLSETAFILSSLNEAHFKIKYFTPTGEIDFCGHATIALAWVLGSVYNYKDKVKELILDTNIGLIPIDWVIENNILKRIVMTQVTPQIREFNEEPNIIFKLLGLSLDDYDSQYPIKLAYTGNWHLVIPIKTKLAIDNAQPDYEDLTIHNQKLGVSTTHLFTFDTKTDSYLIYTRDFAPAAGVNEDPVTGSANGALAGYLVNELILNEFNTYLITQGNSFNRLGLLFVCTKMENKEIKIQIGGSAVVVISGEIAII